MTRNIDGISAPYGMLSRELVELLRETRPEVLCLQRQSARRRRRIPTALAAAVGAAALTLLAFARAFAEPSDQAAHLAQEHHACAVVLGLDPSEAPYQDCVAALGRSLPSVDPPPAVASASAADQTTYQKANAACTDIRLEQGSLAYGRCVVNVDQALSDDQQIYR